MMLQDFLVADPESFPFFLPVFCRLTDILVRGDPDQPQGLPFQRAFIHHPDAHEDLAQVGSAVCFDDDVIPRIRVQVSGDVGDHFSVFL